MNMHGNTIDIGPLTQGARELILFTHQQGADELYGEGRLSDALYSTLDTYAHKYLGENLVGANGEHVFGIDEDGEYAQLAVASEYYLTGIYDGICPVLLDEPVKVDNVETFFVPALEFRICDILGVARVRGARKAAAASMVKCFEKVAMPLVVQTPIVYTLS